MATDNVYMESIRSQLKSRLPLIGRTISDVDLIPMSEIGTLATDGNSVYYAPKFIRENADETNLAILAHEILHISFNHPKRSNGRNQFLWNIATDAVINHILKNSGFSLPDGAVFLPNVENKSADEVYEILEKELEKQKDTQNNLQNQLKNQKKGRQGNNQNQQNSEQNGQGNNKNQQNSEQNGQGNNKNQQNSEQNGQGDRQNQKNSEQNGQGNNQNQQNSEQNGQGNNKNQQNSEQNGQGNNKNQQNSEQNGQGNNKNQQNSEQNGQGNNKNQQNSEQNGQGNNKNGNRTSETTGEDETDPRMSQSQNFPDLTDSGIFADAQKLHQNWGNDSLGNSNRNDRQNKFDNKILEKVEKVFSEKNQSEVNRQQEIQRAQLISSLEARRDEYRKNILSEIPNNVPHINWKKILIKHLKNEKKFAWSDRRSENFNDTSRLTLLKRKSRSQAQILLDVSGSVDDGLLRNFLAQLKPILKDSDIEVGCFDTSFYPFQKVKKFKDIENFAFPDGGGTDIDQAIRHFDKNPKITKIVFTDGCGIMPGNDLKDLNVTWIIFNSTRFEPCCGNVIYMSNAEVNQLSQMKSFPNQNGQNGR